MIDEYDFAVIGGGVVGISILRQLTLSGARCLLLEKAPELLDGASKANSAIMHTGFDAPNGSIEQKAIALGYEEYHKIYKNFGLPEPQNGALLVAYNDEELAQFEEIIQKAKLNNVTNLKRLSAEEVETHEPHLTQSYLGALFIPGEGIIDPWSAPLAYADMAQINGAKILRNHEVTALKFDGTSWSILCGEKQFRATQIVNCAGLYSDKIDEMATGKKRFEIRPRKGQFLVFDKAASKLINNILLPIPTKITKGILICKTAFGNVLVGPTAEEQTSRDCANIDADVQDQLLNTALERIPTLKNYEITSNYAGLRPATEFKDYQIHFDSHIQYTCVGGIRSTGLSSALGLGIMVADKVAENFNTIKEPIWPQANKISEFGERDYQREGNGGIICHCELVTKREIEAAINAPLAPESLAGLKRKTRATMGRCQGFYCTCELARLTEGKLQFPITRGQLGSDQ